MGLLAVSQVVGLLRAAAFWPFVGVWDDFFVSPDLLTLAPHALISIGWMTLGLVLASKRGEQLEELARIS